MMSQYVRNTNQVRLFDDDGALRMPRILAHQKSDFFLARSNMPNVTKNLINKLPIKST